MKREASGKKFSLKFGFQSLNKGKKNSPDTVKKIEPTAAKNKTCNSVKDVNSIKKIDVPTIKLIQIKYPNLEKINCINQS